MRRDMLSPRTISWRKKKQLGFINDTEAALKNSSNKTKESVKEGLVRCLPESLRCAPDLSVILGDKDLLPLFELWADANFASENLCFMQACKRLEQHEQVVHEMNDAIARIVDDILQRFICENGQEALNVSGRCRLTALEGLRELALECPADPLEYQQRACLVLAATKFEVLKMLLTDVYPSFASLIDEIILSRRGRSSLVKTWTASVSQGTDRRLTDKSPKLGSRRTLSRDSGGSGLSNSVTNELGDNNDETSSSTSDE